MPAELDGRPTEHRSARGLSWTRGTMLDDAPMPLTAHLGELRTRLIVSLAILAIATIAVFGRAGAILDWLAEPAGGLVFVAPTEAFYTRLRVSFWAGFVLALPLLLHQIWLFVARALEPAWRDALKRVLPLSYLLFLLGAALALFVVAPAALRFLLSYGSDGVRPMLSLGSYLDFVGGLALAFGGVFQLPLVLYALGAAGIVDRARLAGSRRVAYFLCFLGAAVLTPGPDVVSQLALAVPAAVLFELTLLALPR